MSRNTRVWRGKKAATSRHYGADHPATQAADRELRGAVLEDHIIKVVDQAPPLTAEQRDRLASLLRPSVAQDGGGARAAA